LADFAGADYRTYIPETDQPYAHTWTAKPPEQERAYRNNRRRVRGRRGQRLQRQRSEKVERSFAHVCETGGARRTWLRGLVDVSKRYLLQVAVHNLWIVMRWWFGVGTPRGLQGAARALAAVTMACQLLFRAFPHACAPWDTSGTARHPGSRPILRTE
jgi:hypothetical protein